MILAGMTILVTASSKKIKEAGDAMNVLLEYFQEQSKLYGK